MNQKVHKTDDIYRAILEPSVHSGEERVVASGSMFPALGIADRVRVDTCDSNALGSGDIVVFRSADNKLIAHRLVFKKNFVAVTKGDNNPDCDPPISVFDIVGVVSGKSSKRALWFYFFRNKLRKMSTVRWLVQRVKRIFRR